MAPEVHLKTAYNPQTVDVFSLGVVFFSIYTGNVPFRSSKVDDPLYKLIIKQDWNKFWKYHLTISELQESDSSLSMSAEFMDLISQMLAAQPYMRPSLADIVGHPFFLGHGSVRQQEV